jgi:hypothetical protein
MTMDGFAVVDRAVQKSATGTTVPWQVDVDAQSEPLAPPFELVLCVAPHEGARLFSRRAFARGDAVWPLSGRLATPSERTIQVGSTTHVEDKSGLGFLRHSCEPNVIVDTSAVIMVFALRDIAAGEELTRFHPSTEWDIVRPFACDCHARHCVRVVAGARYLSAEVLSRHFLSAHIRRLLTASVGRSWRP